MYTLVDLEAAKVVLASAEDRLDRYSGNNPNKHRSACELAFANVQMIEAYLKQIGAIPLSDTEILERELDRLFPNVANKEIVEHDGKRYQRKFAPTRRVHSGGVAAWRRYWTAVP